MKIRELRIRALASRTFGGYNKHPRKVLLIPSPASNRCRSVGIRLLELLGLSASDRFI